MKPIISIIDYKMGNLFSVECALNYVGIKSIITDDIELIKKLTVLYFLELELFQKP